MSDLAYQRFMASYILTYEEQLSQNRQEIIDKNSDKMTLSFNIALQYLTRSL
jgi:hypothetical protein